MSLPNAWVDEIFTRLTVRYGRTFLNRWEGVDIELVKADWAKELAGFANWPEAISYAFEHLDSERPPTATVFRDIATKAPRVERPQLEAPKPDADRVKAEISKLRTRDPMGKQDPKDWARKILASHQAGENVRPIAVRFAREALRSHLTGEGA